MLMKLVTYILFCVVAINMTNAGSTKILHLDDLTCPDDIYSLNESVTIKVKWDGSRLSTYCRMSFISKSTSDKVCVEVLPYDNDECDFIIQYFNGNQLRKAYSCTYGEPPKYCTDAGKSLRVRFDAGSTSASSLDLDITIGVQSQQGGADGDEKEDNGPSPWLYVGVTFAIIAGIALVFAILCVVLQRFARS